MLDPRNEYTFKALFVDNPPLLVDLVNAVRGQASTLRSVEIVNPGITPQAIRHGVISLQLLAQDDTGRRSNVDVGMRRLWELPPGDMARAASDLKLPPDARFDRQLPAIGIQLLDLTLLDKLPERAVWTSNIVEIGPPEVVLSQFSCETSMVELPKADRLREQGTDPLYSSGPLSAWVAFLAHAREPEVMNGIDHPPVREALSGLKRLSIDQQHRANADARDQAMLDQVRRNKAAETRPGVEMAIDLVTTLLEARFGPPSAVTVERIRAGTTLDRARWFERLLTADSLEAVFDGTPGRLGIH